VHAKRNLLAVARHSQRQVISALISTIFVQPDGASARGQLRAVVDQLERSHPRSPRG
jgi:transposase-like protein